MNKILKLTTLSVCLMSAASFAETTENNLTLNKISVTGSLSKVGGLKFYSPTSSSNVNVANAQEWGEAQLDSSLRYTSGVQAQLYGADLDDTYWYKIRGFDANLFIDGNPVYNGGYTSYSPVLFGYEEIEVAKGANSVLYGASESGGAINLITKRPKLQPQGLVQLNVGNRGQRGLAVDYNGNYANKLLYRLVSSYSHAKGETYGTWAEQYYFAPSLTWLINDKNSLTVLASVEKSTGVPTTNFYPFVGTVDTSSFEISRRTNLGNPELDYFNRYAQKFNLDYTSEFAQGWQLDLSYNYLRSKRDQLSSYYSWASALPEYYRGYLYNNTTQRSHTLDAHVTNKSNIFGGKNTLVLGAQYNYIKVDGKYGYNTYTGSFNVLDPVYTGSVDLSSMNPYLVNQHQTSLYLQNSFDWNNFILDLGYRFDKVSSKSDTFGSVSSYEATRNTYSLGLMYNFDLGISPFVHYSTSFKPLSGTSGTQAYKPITARQIEYGIKYVPEFIDAKFTLTVFDIKEKNSLIYTSTIAQQIGNNSSKGVELEADVKLLDNLNLNLAYTYMDAKTMVTSGDKSGQKVRTPLTAFNQVATRVSYSFENIPLTLGAGARFFGSSSDELGNSGKTIPSYTVFDLMAKYNFTNNLDLLVSVTNLTNKTYVTGCYYSCYYGEGRKVNATLSYKW
ncbi:TonB-dependent siderophore receptor [Psittacicella gerlachiana]|uniref:Iron complex outermembrane receptor protein n=1 Tax=Psittacicella gerlachiana TaxID=2028574 RepID=A0A3A1YNF2_9GAMM|nr:TonB-dependent siderophore receptor [Psittacicella gerlachiana]RIY38759.1 hypothetical protein CKF59_00270 [Psittacicella gerlachiana]